MGSKSKSKDKESKDKRKGKDQADKKRKEKPKSRGNGKKKKKKKEKKGRRDRRKADQHAYTTANADKYELYQLSVQSPEEDIEFLADVYQSERGKIAHHFREDFCGTALLSATWVRRGDSFTAEAFDIDPEPLDWGRGHHFAELGEHAKRARLHLKDAREPSDQRPEVRCAQNFSYWLFRTRSEMLDYFRRAREDLAADGIFVIDLHGGPECLEEMEEETPLEEGFTYVWDQDEYWPVTNEAKLYIHFRFPDGSELHRAFSYHWRLWGLAELKDLLVDAGFGQVDCYWEGTDEDGESGNGIFTKEERGEACLSYVAYLVALK